MVLNSTPRFVVKKRPNSVPWPNLELVKLIECQRKLATETAITWNKVKQRESQVVELIGRVLEVDHYRPILSLYFFLWKYYDICFYSQLWVKQRKRTSWVDRQVLEVVHQRPPLLLINSVLLLLCKSPSVQCFQCKTLVVVTIATGQWKILALFTCAINTKFLLSMLDNSAKNAQRSDTWTKHSAMMTRKVHAWVLGRYQSSRVVSSPLIYCQT